MTQYLDITQWGVRLTLSSDTSSLYYYISRQLPDVAYFSFKTVSDIAPNCAADKDSMGAISRLTEAQHETNSLASHSDPGTIHIGNFWYGDAGEHADSTDGTAAMRSAVNKAQPTVNFDDIFRTLQATPSPN